MPHDRFDEEDVIVRSDPTGLTLYHLIIAAGAAPGSPPGGTALGNDMWRSRWLNWTRRLTWWARWLPPQPQP